MYRYFFVIFFGTLVGNVSALNLTSYTKTTLLHTDRYCYVSGDFILLKVYHGNSNKNEFLNEAALYVDIANDRHEFIKGEILKLNNGMASGFIRIPDSVKTGYYWLRCYTYNSLKNTNKEVLQTVQIYVTNRFGNNGERYATADSLVFNNDSIYELTDDQCVLNFDKSIYSKRSKVYANVTMYNNSFSDTLWSDITIKPVSAHENELFQRNNAFNQSNRGFGAKPQVQLYAKNGINEGKGIILSGNAKHSITGKPLANYIILLAFEDSILRLRYCFTDDDGDFSFLLNECYGEQMIYLSVFTNPEMLVYTQAAITLNNKFVSNFGVSNIKKTAIGYEISSDSLNVLKSIISKAYDISYLKIPFQPSHDAISFEEIFLAGKLNQTVNIDDFIELPDFIEISREILPFVRLRKRDNGYMFYINDGINSVLRENPMVFVDGVPLTRIENLLSWGSSKIKTVQVQIEPRYYSDISFENGLMFIWTRRRDFWKSSENDYTFKFLISGFQKPVKFNFPDYSVDSIEFKPDFRQILFWEPSFMVSTLQSANFEFYTSDEAGTYEVVLRGITANNKTVYLKKYIQVK